MDIESLIKDLVTDIEIVRKNMPDVKRWDAGSPRLQGMEYAFTCSLGRLLLIQEGNAHHTSDDAVRRAEKHLLGV